MTPGAFDPLRALRTLSRHEVRYVVIGGLGARLHGSPSVTNDTDVCYQRAPANVAAIISSDAMSFPNQIAGASARPAFAEAAREAAGMREPLTGGCCAGSAAWCLAVCARSAAEVGSVQIRNLATLAGNVCNASPAADTPPVLLVYRAQIEFPFFERHGLRRRKAAQALRSARSGRGSC